MALCSLFSILLGILTHAAVHGFEEQANALSSGSCERACGILHSQFGDALHYPNNDSGFVLWDAKQNEVRYACRIVPESSADVAAVLSLLVNEWCRLNTVELLSNSSRMRVGAGATGSQVYDALEPYGLAFVGPRTGTVGVGGFTLGGGTSAVTAEYGWALDNLFEYEVVLPNATVITVNEDQHPDLYFALRGGANNFGIVTYFQLRVFAQGPVLDLDRSYDPNVTDIFLKEAFDIFRVQDTNPQVGFEFVFTYIPQQDRFSLRGTQRYAQPVRNPPEFERLSRIPFQSESGGVGTLASFARSNAPLGRSRYLFNTITHYPSPVLSKRAFHILRQEVQSVANITGFSANLISYSIPARAVSRMKERGGNALGINVKGHLILNNLSLAWAHEADDEQVQLFAARFLQRYQVAARELGLYHPFVYVNYADKGQDVFSSYGERNKRRLIEIQRSIDPMGVFTSNGLWRGFFKLL
ncbi:hypothetical protein IFM58399_00576 [Aspergillus lentulus]|uniref:uncharacterized protein n=1 Tax=Aspergillus lentulus TaxID=293939 RepID=UPI001393A513|nr:uncharacterized protein IFM58399_00576 [Aspergillus lentulus]GFF24208.1 hypothetical protein IFM58399_00576 [Aspergillus lentulus]GFF55277.1 hypothetical protein IFM62136_02805 [Aspergillus lentulus]